MLLSRQLIRDLKILRRGGLREQDFLHNKVVFAREILAGKHCSRRHSTVGLNS